MLPTFGLIDHTTADVPPSMVAVNCTLPDEPRVICEGLTLIDVGFGISVIEDGVSVIEDGVSVIEDCAVLDGSAKLAAVRIIVCNALMVDCALYIPFAIVPTGGFRDQITEVLYVPPIDAWNDLDSPAPTEIEDGVTAMPTVEFR
jgi:hypothetical protein